MQRRKFIGSCTAAAVLAAGSAGAQNSATAAGDIARLKALAAVIVPDPDPVLWSTGAPAMALERTWDAMGSESRAPVSAFLDRLDRAAGGSFAALDPERRSAVLRETLGPPSAWSDQFRSLRSMALRAFYDSPAGLARCGYIPSTQFAGYPQLCNYPPSRKDR
ncbi:gluconate 2-dehydrogenase subunit 3 family protein [bacterium]|nr:gluconate 2-dehydrogenase subunit 3 family protein [bacterium]